MCTFAEKNCTELESIDNGTILATDSHLFDSYVKYECIGNQYVLLGNAVRKCVADSVNEVDWTGSQPVCYGSVTYIQCLWYL